MKKPHISQGALLELLVPLLAVLLSFVVGGLLVMAVGVNPIVAYKAYLYGAIGNRVNLGNTLSVAVPLMICGLGFSFATRASVFNIGMEGQLYMGAALATWVGLRLANLPFPLLPCVIVVAGFIGGGLWGIVPGMLKAKYNINEVVFTVMMSEIALQIISWLVAGPWLDPQGGGTPMSRQLPVAARLPLLLKGTRLHYGLLIALALVVVTYIVLWKTTFGFRLRAVGSNPRAARYAGMGMFSTMSLAMLISGGLAGIAGAVEVVGVHYRLMPGISASYGWTAIVVTLLAKAHPLAMIVSAAFFAALQGGADAMQRKVQVPVHLAQVLQAVTIFFMLAGEYLRSHQLGRIRMLARHALGTPMPAEATAEEDVS